MVAMEKGGLLIDNVSLAFPSMHARAEGLVGLPWQHENYPAEGVKLALHPLVTSQHGIQKGRYMIYE